MYASTSSTATITPNAYGMPAKRSRRKPQATMLPASRIVNAKIMITEAIFSGTAP